MANHIAINTGTLRDIGTQLGRLRDEFSHSTDITGAAAGEMGSGDVAGALNNFASDWSKKRDSLTQNLDTLSTTATQSAEHWDGLDADLAKSLINAFQQTQGAKK
ncbi:hypothetical protein Caci_4619 [Catenulispora acidiphila DSM 44928]|uniref:Uncharacterized protein n=1 Tax=Catenulispora acidiphila (strain DSM 44928 / JCM 14897 / NBRC 102108 / NRRL B-24433 / ID139908) TaxID=479433 RepID=C7PY20_CATAD|nr:hypothetical protein [Catenulispora acidiphila]ACU73480.1 hypothetical protein Caci_4619 [Catenulispora acidiphila DSM 44928]